MLAAVGTVSLAQTLDLAKPVAPGRDGFATFADIPDAGEDAGIDGNQAAVASQVFAAKDLGLNGR